MISPPLRQLLTFVRLAETGSFRRAAERLGLSQPAVSAHIRDLERHFGVPLVHRTTRHVALTAEGQAFAARVRRAIEELGLASQDLRDQAAVHRGRVVIACIPPMMASLMPRVIQRLDRDFPAVEIEIRDVLSGQVEQMVAHGEADYGIGPRPGRAGTLAFTLIERDHFVAAVPRGHALAARKRIELDELARFPMLTVTRDANARHILDQALQRLRHPVKPRFELVHHFSVGRLIEAGLGLTVLPRSAVPSLGNSRIVTLELRSPRVFRDIGVLSRRGYQPSPAAQAFMAVMRSVIDGRRRGAGGRPTG
jgi:LysR family transcriptional regulator, carnitine catabolism transcriptional activator